MNTQMHNRRTRWIEISIAMLFTCLLFTVLGSAPAWAARSPSAVSVSDGTCWGSSATYLVTVSSIGAGTDTGSLSGPTGLPTGVTGAYRSTALNFSDSATSDTMTLVLTFDATAVPATSSFTVTCSPASDTGSVTVSAAPPITGQPQPIATCIGSPATFSVTATGAGLTYQWRKNGSNIAGAMSSTYTIGAVAATDTASYDVVVNGTCNTPSTSVAAALTLTSNSITASAGTNGAISPDGATSVACGANKTYAITPAQHYHVAGVLVDGASVGALASYTFTNVTAAHTIAATFAIDQLTITASAGANGAISPAGAVAVPYGAAQSFTLTPDLYYHVATLTVDGATVAAANSYTFTNVTTHHSIAATFAIETFTITASAGANGTLSPAGASTIARGAAQSYAVTPAACYTIGDVLVDGVSVGAAASYTFSDVTANHTIAASFVPVTYTLTASADPGGSISPNGASSAGCGTTQAFTITADPCHTLSDVLVDGVSVGAVASYSFTNLAADHTIAASFALLGPYTINASAGLGGSIAPVGSVTSPGLSEDFNGSAFPLGWTSFSWPDGTGAGGTPVADGVLTASGGRANPEPYAVGPGHSMEFAAMFRAEPFQAAGFGGGNSLPPNEVFNASPFAVFSSSANGSALITRVMNQGAAVDYAIPGTWLGVSHHYRVDWHAGSVDFYVDGSLVHSEPVAIVEPMRPAFSDYVVDGAGLTVDWVRVGPYQVGCGNNLTLAITPDAGYHVADVKVDGSSVGAVSSYTFSAVSAGHTIAARFANDVYTVTVTTVGSGTVSMSPNGTNFARGDVVQLKATPSQGWMFAGWSGDSIATSDSLSLVVTGTTRLTATFRTVLAVTQLQSPLALAGMRPNPAAGPLDVSFSLPNSKAAVLDMVDIQGRVVRSQDVGGLGAGRHLARLGNAREFAAGIYWLRLRQSGQLLTLKATLVH